MIRVYQNLLRLYPAEYRKQFGEEMIAVFQDLRAENEQKNFLLRSLFSVREFSGLMRGAIAAHCRILMGPQATLSFPTRSFTMRNGFRFPKVTIVFMTVILAGVILAIKRGEEIAYSLPRVSEPVTPIHPVHSGLLPPIPLFFVAFYAAGVIGWVILFALRRSGVHRLAQMSEERK